MPSPLETAVQLHQHGQLLQAAEAYRQTLHSHPASLAALLGLGQIAQQTGQLVPALHMAQAALAAHPNSTLAALALAQLGEALTALHYLQPAQAAFHHALQLNPSLAAANFGLANLLALQQNYDSALHHFQTALAAQPNSPETHFALGFCHAKLARHALAIRHYHQAIQLRPTFAPAWLNLGVALVAEGSPQLAERCYQQALAANPKLLSAHLNLGNLHRSRRNFPQAHQHYREALALEPHNSAVLTALCYLHIDQHQLPQAEQLLHTAQTLHPTDPEIPNAQGILLLAQAEAPHTQAASQTAIEAAIEAFHHAELLGHKTAASNRGNALLRLGRCQQALAAHQSAVDRDPHHPGARYNLALTQLRLGNYAQGWPNYEIRWAFRELHPQPRRYPQPRWQGQPLTAATPGTTPKLLIYSEQGLGDTLQFLRYLPLVAQRLQNSAQIVLEVQPPLARLLAPTLHALRGQVIPHGQPLPAFHQHIPLLSLPALFQTTLTTIPAHFPYLLLDPSLPRQGTLPPNPGQPNHPARLNIGIAWAGNPNYRADHERSTHLKTFLPLLKLPNIRWLSLQKGPAALQIQTLPEPLRPIDAASTDRDLADTAALIHPLDFVITTDTAIAHLAGALAKPLWLLLPWQSDWRWMQSRTDTPWYPSAQLFRQPSPGNWSALIHQVRNHLQHRLTHPQTTPAQPATQICAKKM